MKRLSLTHWLACLITVMPCPTPVNGQSNGRYHVFPQVANGQSADGSSYRFQLTVINTSATERSDCIARFEGLNVTVTDTRGARSSGNRFVLAVPAGGWTVLDSTPEGPLSTGYAALDCTVSVQAHLTYALHAPDGTKVSETTVLSAERFTTALLMADNSGARYALALTNDSADDAEYQIDVFFKRRVFTPTPLPATVQGSRSVVVPRRSTVAGFIDELVSTPGEVPAANYSPSNILIRATNSDAYAPPSVYITSNTATFTEVAPATSYICHPAYFSYILT